MASLLDGKAIAAQIKEEIKNEAAAWQTQGHTPKLAVIAAGQDPASQAYIAAKQKICREVGIDCDLFHFDDTPDKANLEQSLLDLTLRLSADPSIDGIMIEMPLPKGINPDTLLAALDPDKDVDGMSPLNRAKILSGEDGLYPATPTSCIEILTRSGVTLQGKHVVIIGRGETVGKPLVFMLLRHNPTITICHSYTPDLGTFTRQADIIITAVGKPGLLRRSMVKPGAVVVDAGTTQTDEGLRGDAAFAEISECASLISPVPGGVGSLTTVLLLRNILKGMQRRSLR